MSISSDLHFDHLTSAARHIAREMVEVFDLVTQINALQFSVDRHCPVDRARARDDYYISAISSVEATVQSALKTALIADDPEAKYLTADASLVDPAFRGLLTPRA